MSNNIMTMPEGLVWSDLDIAGDITIDMNHLADTYTFAATNNHEIRVEDGNTFVFSDGYSISGAELRACIKVLQKFAKENYPEEFL